MGRIVLCCQIYSNVSILTPLAAVRESLHCLPFSAGWHSRQEFHLASLSAFNGPRGGLPLSVSSITFPPTLPEAPRDLLINPAHTVSHQSSRGTLPGQSCSLLAWAHKPHKT
ncbi:hypothetical protein E2C01_100652 [Portunus trituberculatus]|uniref:Uncharacterized protein n=1 Tax=Portunus trituberculatus TaxID=210409 RepID=A0A5B7KI46_PORTR|nr:hypothetical protein [Portunus trituberculatus]